MKRVWTILASLHFGRREPPWTLHRCWSRLAPNNQTLYIFPLTTLTMLQHPKTMTMRTRSEAIFWSLFCLALVFWLRSPESFDPWNWKHEVWEEHRTHTSQESWRSIQRRKSPWWSWYVIFTAICMSRYIHFAQNWLLGKGSLGGPRIVLVLIFIEVKVWENQLKHTLIFL